MALNLIAPPLSDTAIVAIPMRGIDFAIVSDGSFLFAQLPRCGGVHPVYLQIALMTFGAALALFSVVGALRPVKRSNPFYI
jgi:hypothetical protein